MADTKEQVAHTPGPWIVREDCDGYCEIAAVAEHRDLPLARVWAADLPETAGNPALIAAAPDMYAAIVDFLSRASRGVIFTDDLRAAIAKATHP